MERKKPRILVDANVAYTYLSGRDDPYASEAVRIMELCSTGEIAGFIALHSVSIIWYLGRKLSDEKRRSMLLELCELLTVAGASHHKVVDEYFV